jgi:PAS domain S-box-containing protein
MYGWSEDEALKMNIVDIVPEENSTEALALTEQIRKGEEVTSLETKRKTKDGRN